MLRVLVLGGSTFTRALAFRARACTGTGTGLQWQTTPVPYLAFSPAPFLQQQPIRSIRPIRRHFSLQEKPVDDGPPPLPNGFLLVYKPQGWSSFDVVSKIRGTLEKSYKQQGVKFSRRKRLKVGHGGTLDPLATGLLVLGVGSACRDMHSYLSGSKAYVAKGQLGTETVTQDNEEGALVLATKPFSHLSREDLQQAARQFVGEIWQRPPAYSALKKDGQRMYDLARQGKLSEEDIEPRQVVVHRLEITDFDGDTGVFGLDVECGGGTYIRTLIVDLARSVGSAAHMISLERTQHGPFHIGEDTPIHEQDFSSAGILLTALRPLDVD